MWSTSYEGTTSAPASVVWDRLRALHSGEALGPASDRFELHGPFAVGTGITVTPQGQESMDSVITELEPDAVYADQTAFGELILTFRHRLERLDGGGTRVTHTLEIAGTNADEIGRELGPRISDDFPVAMNELLQAAEGVADQ